MKFLHLGNAANAITFFFAEDKSVRQVGLIKTLSPKDPNFDSWYKDYEKDMNWRKSIINGGNGNKTQRVPGED